MMSFVAVTTCVCQSNSTVMVKMTVVMAQTSQTGVVSLYRLYLINVIGQNKAVFIMAKYGYISMYLLLNDVL